MKKIYFAGKFRKKRAKSLAESLVLDYRAILLGSSELLTKYTKDLCIQNKFVYMGPFYCEQASNGDYTSTNCNDVLRAEYNAVKNSDLCFFVFDQSFSVGSVVELGWALQQNKEIVILYKKEASSYNIKSEYWFAIADAMQKSKKIKIISYETENEKLSAIAKFLKEI